MSLEEILAHRDVLDRHEAPALLMLGDRVDEHRGIPVAQAIERLRDVDGHER